MDLATILAVAVGGLIVFSGYFLFNGLPKSGPSQPRRPVRRS